MKTSNETIEEIPSLEWLSMHANDPEYDELFERLLEQTEVEPDVPGIAKVRASLQAFIDRTSYSPRCKFRFPYRFAFAAVLVALIALVFTLRSSRMEDVEWHEMYSAVGEIKHLELPDGTHLCLNSDTRLIYPSRFGRDSRNIYVDGEVFADVVKDEHCPFVISTRNLKVRVLGTKLRVKSYMDDGSAEVALISGRVEVVAGNGTKSFNRELRPGQMIRYNKEIGSVEEYKVEYDMGFWNHEHSIKFVNESLEDIASDLERRFDVDIVIEGKTLANTQYYASFVNGESLESILNTLNSNGSMKISKLNDAYIITNAK